LVSNRNRIDDWRFAETGFQSIFDVFSIGLGIGKPGFSRFLSESAVFEVFRVFPVSGTLLFWAIRDCQTPKTGFFGNFQSN
jgi:hypothetical protein